MRLIILWGTFHLPKSISHHHLYVVVSFRINNAICVVSGHHGEADIAHEYMKNKMRLLSSLECLCTIYVPFFIPVLVGKSGTILVTEADSVLRENLNKVEKLVFDFRPCRDCVLIKTVRDGGLLHDLQQFGRL